MMGHELKILIGTLFSGENEYEACVESLKAQNYINWEHFVIENRPSREAHRLLYQRFLEASEAFDLFIKLDADMVLNADNCLELIVQEFKKCSTLDHFLTPVEDWYTDSLMLGLHVFSNRAKWNIPENEELFVDPMPDVPGESRIVWEQHWALVKHSPDPSPLQAFHFGVHRSLKVIQLNRKLELLKGWAHAKLLLKVRSHFIAEEDRRLAYVLLGILWTLRSDVDIGPDYSSLVLKKGFEEIEVMTDVQILQLAKGQATHPLKLLLKWGYRIGFLRVIWALPVAIVQLFKSKMFR